MNLQPIGPTPAAVARADAAVWLVRLQADNRTREIEAGFRRWLGESAQNASAFELLTEVWEKSAHIKRRPTERMASWELEGFRMSLSKAAMAAIATALLAVLGTALYLHSDGLATGVGEQRTLTLDDGTRVYLNTNTRAAVHYDADERRVELDQGEALFEVAKESGRPFIVIAGKREIRALGTTFMVRRDRENLSVTLVEGSVAVAPGDAKAIDQKEPNAIRLTAGQRVTYRRSPVPTIDRPSLKRILAWQRGQVVLDNTRLGDAVADMNRYSGIRIVIEDPALAAIRVSGIFTAGDSADFAQAAAKTYGLRISTEPHRIVLTPPSTRDAAPGGAGR